MDLYNRLELGDIRNIPDNLQDDFFYTPIYQILPIEYAKLILSNKVLRFGNVVKYWDDPYELFLLKQSVKIEGTPYTSNYMEHYYGQCWSLNRDTDAMWRIYSPNKGGVRLKTTVGKMILSLEQTRGMFCSSPSFGLVKYIDKNFIVDYLLDIEKGGTDKFFGELFNSLFFKRSEFSHEKEVRFVIFVHETPGDRWQFVKGDYININIVPENFIEEIALDPRLNSDEVEKLVKELNMLGCGIPICQSELYTIETMELNLQFTPITIVNALDKYKLRNPDRL